MFHPSYRGFAVLIILLGGCADRPATLKPSAPEKKQHYAELGGLRRSQDPDLQAELARLEAEQTLPLQLDARRNVAAGDAHSQDPFAQVFPHFSRRVLTEQVEAIYPRGEFAFGPAELNAARTILRRQASGRERFAELIAQQALAVPFRDGLLAPLEALDGAVLGARLEGLRAADALADNAPAAALEPLVIVFRTAQRLADEGRLTSRLAAANVRGEGLRIATAIARRGNTEPNTLRRLSELLTAQLANQPDDARACIADRAIGLHTFELVRDGYFLSLLNEEETKSLQDRNILLVTSKTALKRVDSDELFYLRTMRQMINACTLPYFERRTTLVALRRELESRRNTPEFPLVSGMILLTDFETAYLRLAEDFARTKALLLALQKATGVEPTSIDLNPLTGKSYRVEIAGGNVTVSGILEDSDEAITLPLVRATTSLSR